MPRSRRAKFGLPWIIFGDFKWGQELTNRYRRLSQATNTEGTLLLDIELDNKHLYLSDKYITVESYEHEGVVSDWGSMDLSSGSGGISEISDWSITLFNKRLMYMTTDERISDMLDSYNWEGRTANIRQYFEGLTYIECPILMSGKITNIGFDDLNFYFDIVDTEDVFRDVPINRVSRQEFSEAPSESIGIGKPIVYGKAISRQLYQDKDWCLWPAILLNKRTSKLLIADHKIADDTPFSGRIYTYIDSLKHYLYCYTVLNGVYTNADSGCIYDMKDNVFYRLDLHPTEKGTQYDLVDEDFSNTIDGDLTTGFIIPAEKNFYLKMGNLPDLGPLRSGQLVIDVYVGAVTGSDPYGTIKYYNPDYDAGKAPSFSVNGEIITGGNTEFVYIFGSDFSAHGKNDDQSDIGDAWTWADLSEYEFGITTNAGCTIEVQQITFTAAYLQPYLQQRDVSRKSTERRLIGRRRHV